MLRYCTEVLLKGIDSIDLSQPCESIKKLDKDDVQVGNLDEFLQCFWRYREQCYDAANEGLQNYEEHMNSHDLDCHGKDGKHDNRLCAEHIAKLKLLKEELRPILRAYAVAKHLFEAEMIHRFPKITDFPVMGVREGKVLVGRQHDTRGDNGTLSDFASRNPGRSMELMAFLVVEPVEENFPSGEVATAN